MYFKSSVCHTLDASRRQGTYLSKPCQQYGQRVGWLFSVKHPFETVFQSISGRLLEREKKREMIDLRKVSKQPPPAPTTSAIGPCPTII